MTKKTTAKKTRKTSVKSTRSARTARSTTTKKTKPIKKIAKSTKVVKKSTKKASKKSLFNAHTAIIAAIIAIFALIVMVASMDNTSKNTVTLNRGGFLYTLNAEDTKFATDPKDGPSTVRAEYNNEEYLVVLSPHTDQQEAVDCDNEKLLPQQTSSVADIQIDGSTYSVCATVSPPLLLTSNFKQGETWHTAFIINETDPRSTNEEFAIKLLSSIEIVKQ